MGKKSPRLVKKSDDPCKDELVITPGGPRPKSQVRSIQPGEALRRNEDGSYSVVPTSHPPQPRKE